MDGAALLLGLLALLAGGSTGYGVAQVRQSLSMQRGWDYLAYVAQTRAVGPDDVIDAFGNRA